MIFRRRRGDSGQAFPLYITVAAGLLFLAFAYLAVGQAAVNRSGAQTAADAAALAAAQERRDQLTGKWLIDLADPTTWDGILHGLTDVGPSCWRADELAAQNDAQVQQCDESQALEVQVEVRTNKRVGDSVVPGVSDIRSTRSATAVIKPICDFDVPDEEVPGEEVPGEEAPDEDAPPPDEEADAAPLPALHCEGKIWKLDPEKPGDLPKPEDLFDVHLAD
ncbi:pilus assembly protein TadG-related protein [Streptomyces bauhiniae]|uniref:pilus assembly protein TadG-related protein n=1 Tax=Streptomyces bauhiniae TaxID=2340725 RepID=UPI00362636C7